VVDRVGAVGGRGAGGGWRPGWKVGARPAEGGGGGRTDAEAPCGAAADGEEPAAEAGVDGFGAEEGAGGAGRFGAGGGEGTLCSSQQQRRAARSLEASA
jgi:hypothetical protein